MKSCIINKTLNRKRPLLNLLPIILCILFLFGQSTYSIAKEYKLQAELTDLTGNRVNLSSISPDNQVEIILVYNKGENKWENWATIDSKITKLKSIRLVNIEKKHWKVKFIDGQEVLATVRGNLSGLATISGLSSIPYSIYWRNIKELTFTNTIQTPMTSKKGGLSAQIKLSSGIQFDLFNITTIDLHTSAVYYGLFYGERKDILPLILNDYEIDIPISLIRKINFTDHNKTPLIVNVVYHPPGAQKDIELKGKEIGYGVCELRIKGENWIGSWQLHINKFVGHGLLSMENFIPDPKDKEVIKKEQKTNRGTCITWDEKKWSVNEFIDIKIDVEIGKGKVDLPLDKIKMIKVTKQDFGNKLEILLKNREKITGKGNISGRLKSVDEYGVTVIILSAAIKHFEISEVE